MERLRSCYAGGNIGMFDISYWSYSKVALKQCLTAMQDPSVEELALKVFNSILIYSGVIDAGMWKLSFVLMMKNDETLKNDV